MMPRQVAVLSRRPQSLRDLMPSMHSLRVRLLTITAIFAVALAGMCCSSCSTDSGQASDTTGEIPLDKVLDAGDPAGILGVIDSLREESRHAGRSRQVAIADHLALGARRLSDGGHDGLAESCMRLAVEILRSQPRVEPARLAAALGQLGDILWTRNEYIAADRVLEESLSLLDNLPTRDDADLGMTLNTLGDTRRARGRYEEAAALLSRAQEIATRTGNEPLLVSVLNNLAGLDRDHGQFGDAESKLRQSLTLRLNAKTPDPIAVAVAKLNLGEVFRFQRNYKAAEPLYLEGLALAQTFLEKGDLRLAYYVSQLAQLRAEQGRIEDAEAGYREALDLRKMAPATERAQTLDELGRLLRRAGRTKDAIAALTEAYELREGVPDIGPEDAAATLVELAAARAAERGSGYGVAESLITKALRVLESTGLYLEARIDAYALRAGLLWQRGAKIHARMSLDSAIATAEQLRSQSGGGVMTRARYQAQWLPLYDKMIAWHSADAPDSAFLYAERARARVLLDELATGGADLEAGIPSDVLDPLRRRRLALEDEVAALRARIADPDSAKESAERHARDAERLRIVMEELPPLFEQIRNESPTWRRAGGVPATSVAQIQKNAVPTKGSLLMYHVADESVWLFELRPFPDPVRIYRLSLAVPDAVALGCTPGPLSRSCLDRLIADPDAGLLRTISVDPSAVIDPSNPEPIRKTSPDALVRKLQVAWRALVPSQVRDRLLAAGAGPVVIVPDGVLRLFPFEALVSDRSDTGNSVYWLDVAPPIVYADSASAVAALRGRSVVRAEPSRVYLTVGGVLLDRREGSAIHSHLIPLDGSIEESRSVESRLRAADPNGTFVSPSGAEATEARVTSELPRAQIIHLATHGIVDPGESEYFASLAFTPPVQVVSGADDGYLRLYEIYRLRLQADIAVLSACDGRVGSNVEGEGVFALSRGFLAAGADRVIASLWKVNDAAAGDLIDRLFYHGLGVRGREPAQAWSLALRDAKKEVKAQEGWEDPYFWSAFTYEGVVQVAPAGLSQN